MLRRTFLSAIAAALALVPMTGHATDPVTVDYTPGLIETALADGKTVFVDYAANWCSTCKRQERVIKSLRQANPAYDAAMMFVRVDWDTYKDHEVAAFRDVPRRSTLLVLRGDDELGRIIAGTAEADIKALMDVGLTDGS